MRVIEHNHFSPKPASNRPPKALEHAISTAASIGTLASGPASLPVLTSVSPSPTLPYSTTPIRELSKNNLPCSLRSHANHKTIIANGCDLLRRKFYHTPHRNQVRHTHTPILPAKDKGVATFGMWVFCVWTSLSRTCGDTESPARRCRRRQVPEQSARE